MYLIQHHCSRNNYSKFKAISVPCIVSSSRKTHFLCPLCLTYENVDKYNTKQSDNITTLSLHQHHSHYQLLWYILKQALKRCTKFWSIRVIVSTVTSMMFILHWDEMFLLQSSLKIQDCLKFMHGKKWKSIKKLVKKDYLKFSNRKRSAKFNNIIFGTL
jgi:hypothetical protein